MSILVPEHDEQRRSRSGSRPPKLTTSDYVAGIGLILIVALLWTLSNFVTQYMFVDGNYKKPFMMTYLSTAAFTLYLLPAYVRKSLRDTAFWRKHANYQPLAQDVPSEQDVTTHPLREVDDRLTPEDTRRIALYFCFLWFASNWSLNVALACTSVASATILSSMSSKKLYLVDQAAPKDVKPDGPVGIFILAVGRIFHVETVNLIKIAAVLTSLGGVALVSLSDSASKVIHEHAFNSNSINVLAVVGDMLALLSALGYAVYMVFLKVQIKKDSRIDMQLFFGYVGLFNISLCWPVALLLHWLGLESLELPSTKTAVLAILANMFITLLSDYMYVLSMLKTTPLVATVGLSLTTPMAMVGDYFLGRTVTFQVLLGAVLVTGAFIVVGKEDAKREDDGVLLTDGVAGGGMGEPAPLRLDEGVQLGSQTNGSNA